MNGDMVSWIVCSIGNWLHFARGMNISCELRENFQNHNCHNGHLRKCFQWTIRFITIMRSRCSAVMVFNDESLTQCRMITHKSIREWRGRERVLVGKLSEMTNDKRVSLRITCDDHLLVTALLSTH